MAAQSDALPPPPHLPKGPLDALPAKPTVHLLDGADLKNVLPSELVTRIMSAKNALRTRMYKAAADGATAQMEVSLAQRVATVSYAVEFYFDVSVDDLLKFGGTKADLKPGNPCVVQPCATLPNGRLLASVVQFVTRDDFYTGEEPGAANLFEDPIIIGCTATEERVARVVACGKSAGDLLIEKRAMTDRPNDLHGYYGKIRGVTPKSPATDDSSSKQKYASAVRVVPNRPPQDLERIADVGMLTTGTVCDNAFAFTIEVEGSQNRELVVMPEEHGLIYYLKRNGVKYATFLAHHASKTTPVVPMRPVVEDGIIAPREKDTSSRQDHLLGNYVIAPAGVVKDMIKDALDESKEVSTLESDPNQMLFYVRYAPATKEERDKLEALSDEVRLKKRRINVSIILSLFAERAPHEEAPLWVSPPHILGFWFGGMKILDTFAGFEIEEAEERRFMEEAKKALESRNTQEAARLAEEVKKGRQFQMPQVPPVRLSDHFCEGLAAKREPLKRKMSDFIKRFIATYGVTSSLKPEAKNPPLP